MLISSLSQGYDESIKLKGQNKPILESSSAKQKRAWVAFLLQSLFKNATFPTRLPRSDSKSQTPDSPQSALHLLSFTEFITLENCTVDFIFLIHTEYVFLVYVLPLECKHQEDETFVLFAKEPTSLEQCLARSGLRKNQLNELNCDLCPEIKPEYKHLRYTNGTKKPTVILIKIIFTSYIQGL